MISVFISQKLETFLFKHITKRGKIVRADSTMIFALNLKTIVNLPSKTIVKLPSTMYGCESRTVKKAECRRIDAFELWCWRLLRVPWTARRSNQSILKISPGCSLEGLMLKLKLQYFGHLMRRVDLLEKTLMLGGIGGRRRRGQQDEMAGWHHGLDGREIEWTPGVGDGQGGLVYCDSWGRKESDMTEQLYWTEYMLVTMLGTACLILTFSRSGFK